MKNLLKLALVFVLSSVAFAGEFTESPMPKTEVHKFADTGNRISFVAMVSARSFDTVQTCHNIKIGGGEDQLPGNSCKEVALFNTAFAGAGIGAAWLLHKTGHHKLERFPMWISFAGAAQGIAYSSTH